MFLYQYVFQLKRDIFCWHAYYVNLFEKMKPNNGDIYKVFHRCEFEYGLPYPVSFFGYSHSEDNQRLQDQDQ